MPPKGWKKSQEPSLLHKEVDLVSIDDILFPRATIQKSVRKILDGEESEKMTISKDSLIAIQRAATIFVSNLLFHARLFAKLSGRKNIYAADILMGLDHAGFAGFVPHVKQILTRYEEDIALTRKAKAQKKNTQQNEPIAKKAKVDGNLPLKEDHGATSDDDGADAEDAEDVNDAEDAEDAEDADADGNHDGLVVEEDADEEDETNMNPIAILNQEEVELEGAEPEEPAAVESEAESS